MSIELVQCCGGVGWFQAGMTLGWCGSLITIILLFQNPESVDSRKKIVKLIIPHNIKYVHHTHVLLVKPVTKKKSTKIHEEIVEEEPKYKHVHYHDFQQKSKKPQVHYILPYIESKGDGQRSFKIVSPVLPVKNEKYVVPVDEYHKKRTHSEEVRTKAIGKPLHPALRESYDEQLSPYSYHPSSPYNFEQPFNGQDESYVSSYQTIPEGYETEYLSYNSLENDGPDEYQNENGEWGSEKYSYPDETRVRNTYKDNPHYKYLKIK